MDDIEITDGPGGAVGVRIRGNVVFLSRADAQKIAAKIIGQAART